MKTLSKDWPGYYEFRLKGYFNDQRFACFAEMDISELTNGETRLAGWIEDQAAMYGLLSRFRDLGVLLLSLNRLHGADES